ncbi:MAG: hypothetical protein FWE74_00130 [Oscillospiraceae bacterium]|nr:hypothetical protein [Oscillospiraceae bacterium]
MNQTIRKLFNGEIDPAGKKYYYMLEDELKFAENDLNETFNDRQKELFASYKIAHRNYEREIEFFHFECGYKTASKLIIEGLN